MKAFKHIPEHAFVTIVGIAAFIHSTWTIATFSGGLAPTVSDWMSGLSWLWWVLPGALAAFALEVGQVVTARQIQNGIGRKLHIWKLAINVKTLTFVILSAATYLLQLTYLLHHFPNVPLSAGLSAASQQKGQIVMEIITWGMPLLLPISMLLFTAGDEQSQNAVQTLQAVRVTCPDCDWTREYTDPLAASGGLNGHKRTHSLIPSANGNGNGHGGH